MRRPLAVGVRRALRTHHGGPSLADTLWSDRFEARCHPPHNNRLMAHQISQDARTAVCKRGPCIRVAGPPPFPSLQGRICQEMPDMDAVGVETRHFCHHARSFSLKAVCARPRSAHRRRDVHRLHTVDRRGTVLIPLSAHHFRSCTLLPMHTLRVAMRCTLSSVRRRPMHTTPV